MDDKSAFDDLMDSSNNDVMISVESTAEWQIHDILYDGTERYLRPLTFQDNVAKLAHKIDWKKIVGGESSQFKEEEILDDEQSEPTEGGETEETKPRSSTVDADSVGPWESVAKNLHQALTEMNVLLDVIQIAQNKKYMVVDHVSADAGDQGEANKLVTLAPIFAFKKKVMSLGQKNFDHISDRLFRAKQTASQTKEPDFQAELIELRQAWRLKKVGSTILGDLSYKHYGTKFRPNSTFEVRKNEDDRLTTTAIDITLPKDLENIVCLKITLENVGIGDSQDVYFRGDKPAVRAGTKLWQQKLIIAQRTLLCRDLFAQLSKEAIHLNDVGCWVRGDSICINLRENYVLKISLAPVVAENQVTQFVQQSRRRVFALEHNLFQLFCGDLDNIAATVVNRPVSAPLTSQNRRLRFAGPGALNTTILQSEIESDKLLLSRLIEQAEHYVLVERTREYLSEFSENVKDPAVSVHWSSETTGSWSLARLVMLTPFYESFNKTLMMLELNVNSIVVTTKDGEEIKFSSDVTDMINYFKVTAKQHLIIALGNMARTVAWPPIYCSLSAVDGNGKIIPAILLMNTAGTKSVYVKCPLESDPEVWVQSDAKSRDQFLSDVLTNDLWVNMRGSYRSVDYRNLIGRCFLHKLELLLACLS